eukprot:TRINITY_DN51569_c0_g1_i1.p1 TRINITY_DN51569_c0_g1~~TRINITY_DN51569_c0_g1_i1.p1  ORF type:complete len:170 (-),score=28.63 TRINITY_DN51569_c0_g1_i1:71-580(-)
METASTDSAETGRCLLAPLYSRVWTIAGVTHRCQDACALTSDEICAAARAECWYEIALSQGAVEESQFYAAMCAARMLVGDYTTALRHADKAFLNLPPGDDQDGGLKFLIALQRARALVSIHGRELEAQQVLESCRELVLKHPHPVSAAVLFKRAVSYTHLTLPTKRIV